MTGIFCTFPLSALQEHRLREGVGDAALHLFPSEAAASQARAVFGLCEIVFGNPPASWIAESRCLEWVQLESVGFAEYAALDWTTLGKRLRVTNLAGFFAEPVAESILAGVLSLYRGIDRLATLQAKREWQGDALRPMLRTLKGASVVLFGRGAINARVGQLLAPFQCAVTAFGRDWDAHVLDAALARADVVVAAVPDTPGTRNVFNCARLSILKRGAFFLNFGRGSIVDDDALADLLDAGTLGGAVIDVTREEPLPSGHRFWITRNMILTQHSGGGTVDEIDRKIGVFLNNLARRRRGDPLLGLVDFSRAY
ncbi:MAG TPA: NAD(P)-dependent oxidoreductase [Stellaceae bacterium]|nr:NAD(P)-dependent oxidoreductase [Stellaceae bacterium]